MGQKPGFLSGNLFESVVFCQETGFLKVFVRLGLAIFFGNTADGRSYFWAPAGHFTVMRKSRSYKIIPHLGLQSKISDIKSIDSLQKLKLVDRQGRSHADKATQL
ncbi:hypothetical protein QUB70_00745 [Microcoleus sp. A003_D6]|uniref:hypothetical protein n=1 Tax=Microcoleus sp. A003_D6 TaxID=3055266 RepID=UPI002FD04CE8